MRGKEIICTKTLDESIFTSISIGGCAELLTIGKLGIEDKPENRTLWKDTATF